MLTQRPNDAGCCCCGDRNHLTVDHRIPRSLGGTGESANLQWLCWRCNHVKGLLEGVLAGRTRGRRARATRSVVRELEERWQPFCTEQGHGNDLVCQCAGCLTRPIALAVDAPTPAEELAAALAEPGARMMKYGRRKAGA